MLREGRTQAALLSDVGRRIGTRDVTTDVTDVVSGGWQARRKMRRGSVALAAETFKAVPSLVQLQARTLWRVKG